LKSWYKMGKSALMAGAPTRWSWRGFLPRASTAQPSSTI
jgi:hypothetical protein